MNKRGIVLSQPFERVNGGIKIIGGGPSPLDLRKYLLYWDEIDYPNNNLLRTGCAEDIQLLIDQGIAKRTNIVFEDGPLMRDGKVEMVEHRLLETQQKAFEKNEESEPGVWSLAQLSTTAHLTGEAFLRAIEVDLYNMLPVPQSTVPLADILEFKYKRQAELFALRAYLDEFHGMIIASPDIPRTKNSAMMQIESALQDIDRTLSESRIARLFTSLRYILGNVSGEMLGGAGLAASLSSAIQVDPIDASILGSVAGILLKLVTVPQKVTSPKSPTLYLSAIKKEWPPY